MKGCVENLVYQSFTLIAAPKIHLHVTQINFHMATIIHFNISAEKPTRAKDFCEKLIDWKFELLPGPMDYYMIETKDLDGKPGTGGGMAKRENSEQGELQILSASGR